MNERVTSDVAAGELTAPHFATVLLRRRRWIGGTALALTLATLLAVLLRGRSYTSVSAFTTQSRRTASLSGIAAQLGIAVPGADATLSPQFYADFVRSRPVLAATADTRFPASGGQASDLASLLGVRQADSAETRELVIEELAGRVIASANLRTGIVRVSTRMSSADLALAVNVRLLQLVNEFNLRTRQSQASAERAFTEGRLAEARAALRTTEDRLQAFLQGNRDYRSSPQLSFAADRLQREVGERQQIVSSLAEAYEQARIEEVRDTPIITVVEPAELPVRPDSRRLIVLMVLALLGGAALAGIAALIVDGAGGQAWSDDAAASELREQRPKARTLPTDHSPT